MTVGVLFAAGLGFMGLLAYAFACPPRDDAEPRKVTAAQERDSED